MTRLCRTTPPWFLNGARRAPAVTAATWQPARQPGSPQRSGRRPRTSEGVLVPVGEEQQLSAAKSPARCAYSHAWDQRDRSSAHRSRPNRRPSSAHFSLPLLEEQRDYFFFSSLARLDFAFMAQVKAAEGESASRLSIPLRWPLLVDVFGCQTRVYCFDQ